MPEYSSTEPENVETTLAGQRHDNGNEAPRPDKAVDALAFLDVTESTQRLLTALAALDLESENYRNATAALDRSLDTTTALVTAVKETAEGTERALKALKDSGIPEVIARVEKTEGTLAGLKRTLDEQSESLNSIHESTAAVRDQLAQLATRHDGLSETTLAIRQEVSAHSTVREEQHQDLAVRVAAAAKTGRYTLGAASLAVVIALVGVVVSLVR